jgi:TctA family transporter
MAAVAGVDGALKADVVSWVDGASPADVALLAARPGASTAVVRFMAVAASTVTAAEGSTVVVDTLAADTAAVADTGKLGLIRSPLIW